MTDEDIINLSYIGVDDKNYDSYVVVSVEKGKTGKVQSTYQFDDISSGEQVRSVWIEL